LCSKYFITKGILPSSNDNFSIHGRCITGAEQHEIARYYLNTTLNSIAMNSGATGNQFDLEK
jgi:hypothetical protein